MGSLGRVLAWVTPTPWGEEEPRAAPGLPAILVVLPGKAALTYPDGVNLCDATQLPTNRSHRKSVNDAIVRLCPMLKKKTVLPYSMLIGSKRKPDGLVCCP